MNAPLFVLSTLPKSGTHLIEQVVSPIAELDVWVTTNQHGGWSPKRRKPYNPIADILIAKQGMAEGHIWYSDDLAEFIQWRELPMIFLRRDLRDLVVSEAHHVENLGSAWIHPKKDELAALPSHKDRLKAVMPLVWERWQGFKGWLEHEWILHLTFEELVEDPLESSERIVEYLGVDADPKEMVDAIDPESSYTFRKGKTGSWKEEFDDELIRLWEEISG